MFYENFLKQCNKMNISPSAAAEQMGYKRSVVTRWSKGTAPRNATLVRIADYFGITVDELTKNEKEPDDDRGSLIKQINDLLSDFDQKTLVQALGHLQCVAESNKQDNP